MKGVAKRMVEIVEPQHEYIERVLVVLRSDCPQVRVATRKAEAEKYVAGLVCWKRRFWPNGKNALRTIALCVAGAAVCGVLAVLMW